MSTYGNNGYTNGQPPYMGQVPPGSAGAGPTPPGTNKFFTEIRRLGWQRSQKGWLGGIASAISKNFDWDVALVRGAFIIFMLLAFPVAVLMYVVAWALIPEENTQKIQLEELFESRFSGSQAIILLGGFAALTTNAFKINLHFLSPAFDNAILSISPITLTALVIGLVVFFVHRTKDRERKRNEPGGSAYPFYQQPPAPNAGYASPMPPAASAADSAFPTAAEAASVVPPAGATEPAGAPSEGNQPSAGTETFPIPPADTPTPVYPVTGLPVFQPPAPPAPAMQPGKQPMPLFAPEYAQTGQFVASAPVAHPPIYHPGMLEHPEGRWGKGPGIPAFLGLLGVNLIWITLLFLGRETLLFDLTLRMIAVGIIGMCFVSAGLVLGYLAIRGRRGTWLTGLSIAALFVLPIILGMISYEPLGTY
ncbi:MAG: PspC domain-containing protein [Actinomycetaceae bacterium]|nr:PspC domain-containing protein [Actinomycetaceae bacterium]